MTAKSDWDLHVQPHYPFTQIRDDVWQVTGSCAKNPLPRNMVVYRLESGGLWLHSVVALYSDAMTHLESLGTPEFMVVPNREHTLDAAKYKARYPNLQVLCPQVAMRRVRSIVKVDAAVEDKLPAFGIPCLQPEGVRRYEFCYLIGPPDGRVLVFSDLLFNLKHLHGPEGWLLKTIGSTGFFGMTGVGRFFLLKKKRVFAEWLRKIADTDGLRAICVGHGEAIRDNPRERLIEAADRIYRF